MASKAVFSKDPRKGANRLRGDVGAVAEAPLSAQEIEDTKRLLIAMRARIVGSLSALTADSLQPMLAKEEDVDSVDHDFHLTLAGSEQKLVQEIDDALDRIAAGTYGVCEQTGRQISRARLKALPYARLCVEAQAETERGRPRRRAADLI